MPRYTHVLFDLDGTLTDSRVGITRSVAYALRQFGIHVDNYDTLTPFIGPPLMESFQSIYHFDENQSRLASRHYRHYFLDRGWAENSVYSGIPSLIQDLHRQGVHLYVATSKGEQSARRILTHFHLTPYFDFIAGDTPRHRRPTKADVIRHLIKRQGVCPTDRAVMVGDRRHDIEGACQAGLPSLGVTYGYGNREELMQAGATDIVDTVDALRRFLLA